jgi:hypothetical protein
VNSLINTRQRKTSSSIADENACSHVDDVLPLDTQRSPFERSPNASRSSTPSQRPHQ